MSTDCGARTRIELGSGVQHVLWSNGDLFLEYSYSFGERLVFDPRDCINVVADILQRRIFLPRVLSRIVCCYYSRLTEVTSPPCLLFPNMAFPAYDTRYPYVRRILEKSTGMLVLLREMGRVILNPSGEGILRADQHLPLLLFTNDSVPLLEYIKTCIPQSIIDNDCLVFDADRYFQESYVRFIRNVRAPLLVIEVETCKLVHKADNFVEWQNGLGAAGGMFGTRFPVLCYLSSDATAPPPLAIPAPFVGTYVPERAEFQKQCGMSDDCDLFPYFFRACVECYLQWCSE